MPARASGPVCLAEGPEAWACSRRGGGGGRPLPPKQPRPGFARTYKSTFFSGVTLTSAQPSCRKPDVHDRRLDARLRRITHSESETDKSRASASFFAAEPEVRLEHPLEVLIQLKGDHMPPKILGASPRRVAPGFVSLAIPPSQLEYLDLEPQIEFVEAPRIFHQGIDTSRREVRADPAQLRSSQSTGRGVIIGIIDFGFDFTLEDFIDVDGESRILYLWDQALQPQPGEQSPEGFIYGVEYDRGAIQRALGHVDPFKVVRHRPEPAAHGTHVASIAAGNGRSGDGSYPGGRYIGIAPETDLILVQPYLISWNGAPLSTSTNVVDAAAYIFKKAEELGRPCVINMSLAQNGGSHDGESVVERAFDRMLEVPGRAIVIAAGNEHEWNGHARGQLTPRNASRALHWEVGQGRSSVAVPGSSTVSDRTPNEMEIWYDSRGELRVRVVEPGGGATPWIDPDNRNYFPLGANRVFIDSERFTILNGDGRIYVYVEPPEGGSVTTGTWEVQLELRGSRSTRFDAWIERDARSEPNGFADQSVFADVDFDERTTIGMPATGRRTIVVANYDHRSDAGVPVLSSTSGRGPTRDGRAKPEISAPGTKIVAAHALGGRPGGLSGTYPVRTSMTGTSMAAPHVAGALALVLQANMSLTAGQMRAILAASSRPPPTGSEGHDPAWGFGMLDAASAVALVR